MSVQIIWIFINYRTQYVIKNVSEWLEAKKNNWKNISYLWSEIFPNWNLFHLLIVFFFFQSILLFRTTYSTFFQSVLDRTVAHATSAAKVSGHSKPTPAQMELKLIQEHLINLMCYCYYITPISQSITPRIFKINSFLFVEWARGGEPIYIYRYTNTGITVCHPTLLRPGRGQYTGIKLFLYTVILPMAGMNGITVWPIYRYKRFIVWTHTNTW